MRGVHLQALAQRKALAERTLESLVESIRVAQAVALAGGVAGDAGEPERKRVAVGLYRASKKIVEDADAREPLFGYELRAQARQLAEEAERLARLIARTFSEWPAAATPALEQGDKQS